MNKIKKNTNSKILEIILIAFSAVLTITICSKCSPIYPFNNWDDPNCFFTVGKSMVNGKVLYLDIFEQKGPLLYMLHSLAYLLSHTTFIGIYFVEIIACFVYLFFSYKTIHILCNKNIAFIIPLISALTYSSYSFQGGDSAEELCLPFAAYCFYIGIAAVKNNNKITKIQGILIGISAGAALWFKFTLIGFYIGLIIAFIVIYIHKGWLKDIFYSALTIIFGFLVCSLPVIIYFAKYSAFDSLFEVYFYDNLFLYSTNSIPIIGVIINLIIGIGSFFIFNTFGLACVVSGSLYFAGNKDKTFFKFYLTIIIVTFFFIYIGGRFYAYYPFILSVFSPVGIAGLYLIAKRKYFCLKDCEKEKKRKKVSAVLYFVLVFVVFALSPNISLLKYSKDDMPQYRFDKIISKKENPTLLNYGFLDGGFYTVSDIVPNCKFFCELNVPYEEMYIVQDKYISEGKVDFVVTKDEQLESSLYIKVDECEFIYANGISKYYLYKKIS